MERIREPTGKCRNRLKKEGGGGGGEGNQSVTNRNQLKPKVADGKFYKTDVADREQLLRLIQSIPSPKSPRGFRLEIERMSHKEKRDFFIH